MLLTLRFVGGSPFTLDIPDGSTVSSVLTLIHSHYPDALPSHTRLVHRSTFLPVSSRLSISPTDCLLVLPQRFLPPPPPSNLTLAPGAPAGSHSSPSGDPNISALTAMGFSEASARSALERANFRLDAAVELLLRGDYPIAPAMTTFNGFSVPRIEPAHAALFAAHPELFARLVDGVSPDLRVAVLADIPGFARALGVDPAQLDIEAVRAHLNRRHFHGIPVEQIAPAMAADLIAHPGKLPSVLAGMVDKLAPDVAQQMRDDITGFVRAIGLDPGRFNLEAARRAVVDAINNRELLHEFQALPPQVIMDVVAEARGDVGRAREWLRQMLA